MRRARFTEHQGIAVLKSVEVGRTVKDVCREAAISEASYYNRKPQKVSGTKKGLLALSMGLKGSDLISWLQTSRDKLKAQKSPQGLRRAGS